MKRSIFVVAAAAAALIAPTAWSTHGAPLSETVTVAADEAIPNDGEPHHLTVQAGQPVFTGITTSAIS